MTKDDNFNDMIVRDAQERRRKDEEALERQRLRDQRFDQIQFNRRNSLFKELTDRGEETQRRYREFGQVFCGPFGDTMRITKSKHPSGSVYLAWDREARRLDVSFRYGEGNGDELHFDLVLSDDGNGIVITEGSAALSDSDVAEAIFGRFIPRVA